MNPYDVRPRIYFECFRAIRPKASEHQRTGTEELGVVTASISELQKALASERQDAAELAEKALAAVDTVLGAANFWLALLSFGLALVGVIGAAVIYLGVKRAAVKVANDAMKSYLDGEAVKKLIQQGIADEIRKVTLVEVNPQRSEATVRGGFKRRDEKEDGHDTTR